MNQYVLWHVCVPLPGMWQDPKYTQSSSDTTVAGLGVSKGIFVTSVCGSS